MSGRRSASETLLEESQDLCLLRLCLRRAASPSARGLGRQQHRGRAALGLLLGIGAALEKHLHSGRTTRAHGSVQRCHTSFVRGIGVGPSLN